MPVVTNCIQCGYSLEGLGDDASCPECATPVARSRFGFLFVYAGDDYARAVVRGLRLVTIGVLVLVVLAVVLFVANVAMRGTGPRPYTPLLALAMLVPLAMIFFGYHAFASPDPGLSPDDQPRLARMVARVGVLACAAAVALSLLSPLLVAVGLGVGPLALALGWLRGLLIVAGVGMAFFGGGLCLVWLAKRIPDKKLVRRAKRSLWLVPLLSLMPLLLSIGVATTIALGAGGMALPRSIAIVLGCGSLVLWLASLILWWNLLDGVRKGIVNARASAVAPRPLGGPA